MDLLPSTYKRGQNRGEMRCSQGHLMLLMKKCRFSWWNITLSVLTRDYPLEMINENIQVMDHTRDINPNHQKNATPYCPLSPYILLKFKALSKKTNSQWNLIQNDTIQKLLLLVGNRPQNHCNTKPQKNNNNNNNKK